jgi:hypothetical protein
MTNDECTHARAAHSPVLRDRELVSGATASRSIHVIEPSTAAALVQRGFELTTRTEKLSVQPVGAEADRGAGAISEARA